MADTAVGDHPTMFRLMDLPNEIIREICNCPELEPDDLCSLRLTSKHLCEYASNHFAKKCFTRVTVLMSRPSLRAFIELSQHPYFGPVVQQISISPVFAPHACDVDFPTPATSLVAAGRHGLHMSELVAIYLDRSRREHELSTDGSVERMLRVAFKAFAQREQCLKLRFHDNEVDAIGARNPLRDKVSGSYLVWRLDWKTVFDQTIRACTSQDCKITELSINERGRYNSVDESSLRLDDIEQELSSMCSGLTRLEIEVWNEEIEITSKSFRSMVSTAKNLKSLTLHGFGQWNYFRIPYLREILDCVASTTLETIFFHGFQLTELELFDFLGRQARTLQELYLSEGCLSTGSCMSLVAWIRDNLPGLRDLELHNICHSHDQTSCVDEGCNSYWIYPNDNMQDCLASILNGKYVTEFEKMDEDEQVERERFPRNKARYR